MRRKDREVIDFEKIKEIISECDVIRLGLREGSYPYIVPMNFGYEIIDEQIYFYIHGAVEGHKIDLMKINKVCSFEMDCGHKLELMYEHKNVTMRYKSLMGKADIEFLDGDDKYRALDILMNKSEKTKDFEYNRSMAENTMTARLRVTEYSAKINA